MAEAAQGGLTHPSIQSRQLEENLGNRLQGIGRGGPPWFFQVRAENVDK